MQRLTRLSSRTSPTTPAYTLVNRLRSDGEAQRDELLRGLLAANAAIAPKYFYDPLGAALFTAICELDEYYPPRTEAAIFAHYRTEIARAVGYGRQFVDLGAGDCAKAEDWFATLRPTRYVAVDIAEAGLHDALTRLAAKHGDIELAGVVTDFSGRLDVRRDLAGMPTTFFYPGSSIGNFTNEEALRFLREIFGHARAGDNLLIGVDTKKDEARLLAAYDDAVGVTAAFNRNVLRHVNRLLAGDFQPSSYVHVAHYNARLGRIEIYLEAIREQRVNLAGHRRLFAAGERIHTENSYKYAPPEFVALLEQVGYSDIVCWQDEACDFAVYAARVR
jgi:L-histidine N-alpha-methyltransferase